MSHYQQFRPEPEPTEPLWVALAVWLLLCVSLYALALAIMGTAA